MEAQLKSKNDIILQFNKQTKDTAQLEAKIIQLKLALAEKDKFTAKNLIEHRLVTQNTQNEQTTKQTLSTEKQSTKEQPKVEEIKDKQENLDEENVDENKENNEKGNEEDNYNNLATTDLIDEDPNVPTTNEY